VPKKRTEISYNGLEVATKKLSTGEEIEILFSKKNDGLVFVYFHGNVGRLEYIVDFLKQNYSFVSVSYAGYKGSSGKPSVKNIYEAVEKTKEFVREEFPKRRIFVMGHSLGSQTAMRYSIIEENTKVLAIINGFDSIYNLCKDRLQKLSLACIIAKSSFDAVKDFNSSKGGNFEFLVFHNPKDVVIPFERGLKLFENIKKDNKNFVTLKQGDHGFFNMQFVTIEMLDSDNFFENQEAN
jgi:dienelactone hydrolase